MNKQAPEKESYIEKETVVAEAVEDLTSVNEVIDRANEEDARKEKLDLRDQAFLDFEGALKIKQNRRLLEFNRINIKKGFSVSESSLKAFTSGIQLKNAQAGQLRIALKGEDIKDLELTPATQRTFAVINALATAANYDFSERNKDTVCRIKAPISFFKELYGATNQQALERRLKRDITTLESLYLTEESEDDTAFIDIPMAGGSCGIDKKRGPDRCLYFTLSPDFMRAFFGFRSSIIPLDKELFKANLQSYEHSYTMGIKLYSQRWSNPQLEDAVRISVTSLLEAAPTIPKPETVTDRNFTKSIIRPFEASLNHLKDIGVLEDWTYCHAKGEPLNEKELAAMLDDDGEYTKPLPYSIAKDVLVEYSLKHKHEDFRQQRLKGREQAAIKAAAVKARKEEDKAAQRRSKNRKLGELNARKEHNDEVDN